MVSKEPSIANESSERDLSQSRRRFVQLIGLGTGGLVFGSRATTVSAAPPSDLPGKARPDQAALPQLEVSSPSRATIKLVYASGNPPLTVYVYDSNGNEYSIVTLTKDSRVRTLTEVPGGTYTIEAHPSQVSGSPLVVEPPCDIFTEDIGVVELRCAENGYGYLYLANPNDAPVMLSRVHTDPTGNERSLPSMVLAGNTTREFVDVINPGYSATITAVSNEGCETMVPIEGQSSYTAMCSN